MATLPKPVADIADCRLESRVKTRKSDPTSTSTTLTKTVASIPVFQSLTFPLKAHLGLWLCLFVFSLCPGLSLVFQSIKQSPGLPSQSPSQTLPFSQRWPAPPSQPVQHCISHDNSSFQFSKQRWFNKNQSFYSLINQHTIGTLDYNLRSSSNHVWNIRLMAGSIEDGEMLFLRLKVCSSNLKRLKPALVHCAHCISSPFYLHCLSLVALLSIGVHAPWEVPGLTVYLLCLLLILLQCPLVHHVCQVHNLSSNGWLS